MKSSFTIQELDHYLDVRFYIEESANALSLTAARELGAITKKYKKWTKPVVVRSAHPRLFCSGGNLSDYKKLKSKSEGLRINREITQCLNAFGSWPTLKLAVVEGDVLGGGMEWLARFDSRWSTPTSVFAFWQRRIGLSPGWGGGAWWAEKIGEEKLRHLLVEAAPVTAEEALRLNLIERIIPEWRLKNEIEKFVRDQGYPSSRVANSWSAKKEAKIFSDLWLAEEHSQVLKNWR